MRTFTLWRRIGLTALLMSVLSDAATGAQCAMCRTVLVSPEGQRLAAALRAGIAILIAAPFGVFAVVAYIAVRSQRRFEARRRRE